MFFMLKDKLNALTSESARLHTECESKKDSLVKFDEESVVAEVVSKECYL